MVAEALDITRETYFAILMDRACNGPVMVGSPQGGMDIEEVAANTPELIFKVRGCCLQSSWRQLNRAPAHTHNDHKAPGAGRECGQSPVSFLSHLFFFFPSFL